MRLQALVSGLTLTFSSNLTDVRPTAVFPVRISCRVPQLHSISPPHRSFDVDFGIQSPRLYRTHLTQKSQGTIISTCWIYATISSIPE
ncbi:hypothetical protein FB45DRAFT_902268 [Roridomyces roridus]|uniref:Uncharacterized protein n=1 Tax=Roridomyces roridus TaxID=1738132 RepID=A0AAD7C3I0_9AGAR|nr:hypothetical protein FB45DRAFT_902268 [Roridomyces roridus]